MNKAIDVSQPVSEAHFREVRKAGYDRLIVRAFRSTGQVDTGAPSTIENALAAGCGESATFLF